MNRKILTVSILTISIFLFLYSFINPINALYSQEVTGLTYTYGFDTNQGRYAEAGTYQIYSSDNKIMIYTNLGELIREVPITVNNNPKISIISLNTTHIIVGLAHTLYSSPSLQEKFKFYFLDVNSGTLTEIYNDSVSTGLSGTISQIVFFMVRFGTTVYSFAQFYSTTAATCRIFVGQVYPTWSGLTLKSSGTPLLGSGGSIVAQDPSNTNIFYVIGGAPASYGTSRYSIVYWDVSTQNVTLLGVSGIDYTWGNRAFFGGNSYDNMGSFEYHDILAATTDPSDPTNIKMRLIRFNQTYIDPTTSLDLVCDSYNSPCAPSGVIGPNGTILVNSDYYDCVFVGDYSTSQYAMVRIKFCVRDLDSPGPSLALNTEFPYYAGQYPYEGKISKYNVTNSFAYVATHYELRDVNTPQPQPNLIFYGDIANGYGVVETLIEPLHVWTYSDTYPDNQPSDPFYVEPLWYRSIWNNDVYKHDVSVYCDGVKNADGYVEVWIDAYNPIEELNENVQLIATVQMNNGFFSYNINPALFPNVNNTLNIGYYVYVTNIDTHNPALSIGNHYVVIDNPYVGPSNAPDYVFGMTTYQIYAMIIPVFLFVGLPSLFIILLGFNGFYVGITLATVVGIMGGLIPFYFVALSALLIVATLYLKPRS